MAEENIITLQAENGKEIEFREIASISLDYGMYAILQPVELFEGMKEDEAIVFRVKQNEGDQDAFEVETDDDIIQAVFAEYTRLMEEQGSGE